MVLSTSWLSRASIVLCIYGAFKGCRPLEPFLTPYLTAPPINLTLYEINGVVNPQWTYGYMILLVPVFILTDLLRYRPVLVLESLGLIGAFTLLIVGRHLGDFIAESWCFSIQSAAEVAYYSYIYSAVPLDHYRTVTSYIRAAIFVGRLVGYGFGQYLYSTMEAQAAYRIMAYTSLGSVSLTLPLILLLPPANKPQHALATMTITEEIRSYFSSLFYTFRQCYTSWAIAKWSLWWSLATCGFLLVWNYKQNIWTDIQNNTGATDYNGLTETINTLLEIICIVAMQFVRVDWAKYGEFVLAVMSFLQGALLLLHANTNIMLLAYIVYILYSCIYQMLITIATFNVAKKMNQSSHESTALVFGVNTFIALVVQTIITVLIADNATQIVDLSIINQFNVYAVYHFMIAVLYTIFALITLCKVLRNEEY